MTTLLVFIAVLSVLVFFHELGHFLAAKACGIYVDQFSIGMPPRVAGLKWGETDYCIGALPIGGYVKMAGQEDAPLSEEEREQTYGHVPPDRWFNKKPIWQRYIVILAGPLMNFALAVVLYAIIAAMGAKVPESAVAARIGRVEPNSPAAAAPLYRVVEGRAPADYTGAPDATGWQPGDFVMTLDGNPVETIIDLAVGAVVGGGATTHYLELEREAPDGVRTRYLSPIVAAQIDPEGRPRFGVSSFDTPVVTNVMPDMAGAKAGLEPGDAIIRVDGQFADLSGFIEHIERVPEGTTVSLDIERKGERLAKSFAPTTVGRFQSMNYTAEDAATPEALDAATPTVAFVTPEYGQQTGLRRKDRIVTIDGAPATFKALREAEMGRPGGTVKVGVERPAVLFGLLQDAATLELELPVQSVRAIGVALAPRTVGHRVPAAQLLPEAVRQCYAAIHQTIMILGGLAGGTVSPKDLGGPIMIAQVASAAAEQGWYWLIKTTAYISINLGVFNLLPLPVLDGGQLALMAIEAVRRRPLSPKFQERFQFAGLLLIVSLMLFITWNDIGRLITQITP